MQVSEAIESVVARLREIAESEGNTPTLTKSLQDFAQQLEETRRSILEIEKFVPLPFQVETEPLNFDDLSIDELTKTSELITAIHRAGVTVKSRHVFSKTEIEVSKAIAENFNDFSTPLAAYRGARKDNEKEEWSIRIQGGKAGFQFIDALERIGVVHVSAILLKSGKKWTRFRREWTKTTKPDQLFLVIFKLLDMHIHSFLKGDWMTAFVSKVIHDHLTRNEIEHELFSKVAYAAPADVINSKSDFDVVSLLADQRTANCFECKSGRIDQKVAMEISAKGSEIKRVLEQFSPGIDTVNLFLVYDHHLNDDSDVRELFSTTDVIPKRIDQVRELVMSWL